MKNKLKGYCEILEDHEQKSRIKEIIKKKNKKKLHYTRRLKRQASSRRFGKYHAESTNKPLEHVKEILTLKVI